MTAFIRGVGPAVSNSTGADLEVTTPARFRGDVVLVQVVTSFPNDATGLALGVPEVAAAGLTSISFVGDTKSRFRILAREIDASDTGAPYTLVRTGGLDTGSDTVFAAKAFVIGGVQSGLAGIAAATAGPHTAAGGPIPALPSPGTNGLDLMFMGSVTPVLGLGPPAGYTTYTSETMGTGLGVGYVLYTAPASGALPAGPSSMPAAGLNGKYAYIGLAVTSSVTIDMPAVAPAALLRLGCAETYQVFVTRNDPVTQQPVVVDAVGWSSIQWSRVLDEVSSASVDIPDRYGGVNCCAKLGGLIPWTYGLRIERNARLVWQGPVTSVSRPSAGAHSLPLLRVEASDLLARFAKRLATHSITLQYTNLDAGTVFASLLGNAQYADPLTNGFSFPYPIVTIGTGITREVVARNFEIAWDILKDLLDSAIDAYVMNNVLYVFEPTVGWAYNDGTTDLVFKGPADAPSGELLYGLFTESSFKERPGWSISGIGQANQAWEPGADVGEEGARRYWTSTDPSSIGQVGVLDVVDANPLYRSSNEGVVISDATFQRRADSIIRQRSHTPAVVSGGALADDAPVDVDNLRPGSIWRMDYADACFGQLLQNVRLKRVVVDVSRESGGELIETVSPTLFPVGYTEANL